MKSHLTLLLLMCSFVLSSFRAKDTVEMDDVVIALKSGNASQLSRYFDTRIDLSLPDKSDNYSRTQAEMIIKEFFSSTGVRNFELKHKSEKTGSNYCVGTLQTKIGNFRTTLFMKQKGDRHYLQDLSFQKIE